MKVGDVVTLTPAGEAEWLKGSGLHHAAAFNGPAEILRINPASAWPLTIRDTAGAVDVMRAGDLLAASPAAIPVAVASPLWDSVTACQCRLLDDGHRCGRPNSDGWDALRSVFE